jgi:hypothetical protein
MELFVKTFLNSEYTVLSNDESGTQVCLKKSAGIDCTD